MRKTITTIALLTFAVSAPASASVFNFMTLGVNDTTLADTNATAVSLVAFTYNTVTNTLTPAAPVNVNSSSATAELTLSAKSGNHDGMLRLSGDGTLLTFAGYRAAAGDPNPITTSAASVNRVIGQYNIATGAVDTSVSFNDAYNYGTLTTAATQDGKEFWTAGTFGATSAAATTMDLSGGVRYASPANIAAHSTTNIGNVQVTGGTPQVDSDRSLLIAGNNLYVTTPAQNSYNVISPTDGKTYFRGTYQVGTNVPLTQSTSNTYFPVMNNLASDPGQEIVSDASGTYVPKSDIVFADLNPAIPGFDTAYGTGGKQEYEKWSLVQNGVGQNGAPIYIWKQISIFVFKEVDINGLAIDVQSSGLVDIFATNDLGIYHFTDALGYQSVADGGITNIAAPAEIYSAAAGGLQMRGIAAFTPAPEPASLSLLALSSLPLIKRRNRGGK